MTEATKRNAADRIAWMLFFLASTMIIFAAGILVGGSTGVLDHLSKVIVDGLEEVHNQRNRTVSPDEISDKHLPFYYQRAQNPGGKAVHRTNRTHPGLNLVTRVASHMNLAAEIVDMDGRTVHAWDVDWFKLWPDAQHVPEPFIPKSHPGTHIHGAVVMGNGDLIFNFEHLGLVRLDQDSQVVWRLPYRTHHSIHVHDDGNLWVCGQQLHEERSPLFPHRSLPFDEYTVLEISPDGKILAAWSVPELLHKNGLAGLLYLQRSEPHDQIYNDVLHLNDVEPFPEHMEEGFFGKGDVLVSLRNINTVFVFNRDTEEITYSCTGMFYRQHDPDFIDGDRFSVFDNIAYNREGKKQSRIVIVSAPQNTCDTYFEGNPDTPFFTRMMGKHQWLANGNLLLTEAQPGRALEIDPDGKVVWQYTNYVDEGTVGLMEEVQRLPPEMKRLFDQGGDS